ncbi:MAG TPA: DCC1-like thiol-disulfide oxidoreductase family protein [Pyrinomonadaceae bacterium]|nr:DCC1-like thiol-disulfide oxidoreductase family protein [Pyrinomonadaceae bacterium]
MASRAKYIVLFDGVCNFCNGAVNFIIDHDSEKRFVFAALQSETGVALAKEYFIPKEVDSVILIEEGMAHMHSTAGLRIARGLGGIWSAAYVFIIVPAFIRDWVYKTFAKYRYRLFGRTEACMMPTAEVRERFI